jgi:transposase-like protein
MDGETLDCPHRHCRGYGKPFSQGYLVKNGTSRGQPRAWCQACEARVVVRYGTAYDGLEADPAIVETAVRALAEGNALRATARLVHVDKDPVCSWLHRVACHCRTVMLSFWRDLPVSACQGGASARGQDLLRHLWGRLGVDRLCSGLALGPGLRDRQAGSGRCGCVAGPCRPCHG